MSFLFNLPKLSAKDASYEAQKIAFSPLTFQAVRIAWKRDLLTTINQHKKGISPAALSKIVKMSLYGVRVILESCLSIGVLTFKNEKYFISKVGQIFLYDKMTQINMNYVNDVNYQGMFYLDKAIDDGIPAGLHHTFNQDPTIYPGLNTLPEPAKTSWFEFDHFYSDNAFVTALPYIFKQPIKTVLDIGGNTGKFAISISNYNAAVKTTIIDIPEQLAVAKTNITQAGFNNRVDAKYIDMLDHTQALPKNYDVIWMSQFLDCFGDDDIIAILTRVAQSLSQTSRVFILETFWDNQKSAAATHCVINTSLYFSAMANGKSRMYRLADMLKFIDLAGLTTIEKIEDFNIGHTLLILTLKPN